MSAPTEGVLATYILAGTMPIRFEWVPNPHRPAISVAEHERLVAEARAEERAAERARCAAIVEAERAAWRGDGPAAHPALLACDSIADAIEADR